MKKLRDKVSWCFYLMMKFRYRHVVLRGLGWSRRDCRRVGWLLWRFRKFGWLETLHACEQLAAVGVEPAEIKEQLGKLYWGHVSSGMIFEDYVRDFCTQLARWGLR